MAGKDVLERLKDDHREVEEREMFRQAEESELDFDAMAAEVDAFEEPEDD